MTRMNRAETARRIIGCCFAVHRERGPGSPEKVYQKALECALEKAGIECERTRRFQVSLQGIQVGDVEADVVVEKDAVVEVKAVVGVMPKICEAPWLAYLKASRAPIDLRVNVGNRSCHIKRFVI